MFRKVAEAADSGLSDNLQKNLQKLRSGIDTPTGVRVSADGDFLAFSPQQAWQYLRGNHPAQLMQKRMDAVPAGGPKLMAAGGVAPSWVSSNWLGLGDQKDADTFSQDALKNTFKGVGLKAEDPGVIRNYWEALKRGHTGTVLGTAGGLGLGAYALYKLLGKKKEPQEKTAAAFMEFGKNVLMPSRWARGIANKLEQSRLTKGTPGMGGPAPGLTERAARTLGRNPWKTNLGAAAVGAAGYGAAKSLGGTPGEPPPATGAQPKWWDNVSSPTWWNTDNATIGGFKPWQAAAGVGGLGLGAYALYKLLNSNDEKDG
jgi:hypothetical protein